MDAIVFGKLWRYVMRPIKRHGVSKGASAKKFRNHTKYTKSPNMRMPMRGGWRL